MNVYIFPNLKKKNCIKKKEIKFSNPPQKFFPYLKLPIGLIISLSYGSPSPGFSRYSRKSSAGKQAVCVCCLTAALIRPL